MKKYLIVILLALVSLSARAQYSAVRINALGWATGTINAGVDVALSDKWSIEFSGYWNPIGTENLRMKVLAGTLGVRRWRFEPHVGLFWGVHSTVAKYEVGNRRVRYNGWTAGAGCSVGYSWMLSRRWNITLEGGAGLFYMEDMKYSPDAAPTVDEIVVHNYKRVVLAPSKFEVAFSYLF